jgi:hypothetical protein
MIEGKRLFNLTEEKPAFSQWFVTVDITDFLGDETIQGVVFTAIREGTGENVSDVVLDQLKCTYTGGYLRPFIRGGQPGATYLVEMRVTTIEGTQEVFWIRFDVINYWESYQKTISLDAVLYA